VALVLNHQSLLILILNGYFH